MRKRQANENRQNKLSEHDELSESYSSYESEIEADKNGMR